MKNLKKSLPIKSRTLLAQALTHRSWLNEHQGQIIDSNERLEFLGDAVLELIVTEYLFETFPDQQEGVLTALRASLVRTETLSKIAKSLKLGKYLKLSHGEDLGGGRKNESLLANTFEAVIGAIYLESGKDVATKFVRKILIPELDAIRKNHLEKDAKSLLQEKVQAKGLPAPIYQILNETGPDHNKVFTLAVLIEDKQVATGTGKSKQHAQQEAAKDALEKY